MLQEKKYYKYEIGGYTYEIEITDKLTEIWIYKKEYGVKLYLFGMAKKWKEEEIINYIKSAHKFNRLNYKEEVED